VKEERRSESVEFPLRPSGCVPLVNVPKVHTLGSRVFRGRYYDQSALLECGGNEPSSIRLIHMFKDIDEQDQIVHWQFREDINRIADVHFVVDRSQERGHVRFKDLNRVNPSGPLGIVRCPEPELEVLPRDETVLPESGPDVKDALRIYLMDKPRYRAYLSELATGQDCDLPYVSVAW